MDAKQTYYMQLLIERIELAPNKRIDMDRWGCRLDKPCGTAGCAGGYALTIPELRAAGLSGYHHPRGTLKPSYGGFEGIDALKMFFGLTSQEAVWLFHQESYDFNSDGNRRGDKGTLLKRLRSVLKKYQKELIEDTVLNRDGSVVSPEGKSP